MFNLAERFWDWKKRKAASLPLYTIEGFKVVQFGEKWAVRSKIPGKFRDLTGDHSWTRNDRWFKDCLARKEKIEELFGKIIEKDA